VAAGLARPAHLVTQPDELEDASESNSVVKAVYVVDLILPMYTWSAMLIILPGTIARAFGETFTPADFAVVKHHTRMLGFVLILRAVFCFDVDGNGRRNYSTVWSVYTVCSALSLTGYGVRNAGLVLLAVVCNAVVLMLVVYDCPAETVMLSWSGIGEIILNPLELLISGGISIYLYAIIVFAAMVLIERAKPYCQACFGS
jgi:hypothetical protein